MPVLHVCVTCRAGGPGPEAGPVAGQRLLDRLRALAPEADLRETGCLANCERGCSAAIAAPGKWTVLLGRLDPELAGDLLLYADAFDASRNGTVMPSRRPASLAGMVQGRVPPEAAAPRAAEAGPSDAAALPPGPAPAISLAESQPAAAPVGAAA